MGPGRKAYTSASGRGALRRFHDTLGKGMVYVLLKSGLLALQQPPLAPCRPRAVLLQLLTTPGKPLAFGVDCRAAIRRATRIDGQIDEAQINTQHLLYADLFRLKNITDDGNIEDTPDVHQAHFPWRTPGQ